ncbi:D-Ala-D-Ala carboxypeptidase family metallohydrolase [Kiloniella sp. b19]|uniref:D-Ala-D-Ala carboxypeptidase family metallohydrolase n=1 Tax=Kiloniella sp. GXU_MW_B19 TaxID=3141326 RepID=UPI0031DA19DE
MMDTSPDWSLYPDFSREEFVCSCGCNRAEMQPAFLERLQALRNRVGPLKVTSGFRCEQHPVEARKSKPGAHAFGLAADVRAMQAGRYAVVLAAFDQEFRGIGVARNFVHLDVGHPHQARPALWSY